MRTADPDLGASPFLPSGTMLLGGIEVDTEELARAAHVLAGAVLHLDGLGTALRGVEAGAALDLARALAVSAATAALDTVAGIPGDGGAHDRVRVLAAAAEIEERVEDVRTRASVLRGCVEDRRSEVTAAALAYGAADETAAAAFWPASSSTGLIGFGPATLRRPTAGDLTDPLVGGLGAALLLGGLGLLSRPGPGGVPPLGAGYGLVRSRRGLLHNGAPVDLDALTPAQAAAFLASTSFPLRAFGPPDARTDRVTVWDARLPVPPGREAGTREGSWLEADTWRSALRPGLGEDGRVVLEDVGEVIGDALDGGADLLETVVPWAGGKLALAAGTAAGVPALGVVLKQVVKKPLQWVGREAGQEADGLVVRTARADLASGRLSPAGIALNRGILRGYGALEQCYPGAPIDPDALRRSPTLPPPPVRTAPAAVPALGTVPAPAAGSLSGTLLDLAQVKESVGVEGAGAVRVDTSTFPDGRRSHLVLVPGTENFTSNGGTQPHDLLADLEMVAGRPSAVEAEVQASMDQAGVRPGDTVVFVGHSGGALAVSALAADPVMQTKYDISHVLAAGGPAAPGTVPESTRMLTVQNDADLVPGLDGVRARPTAAHLVLQGPAPSASAEFYGEHRQETYAQQLRGAHLLGDPRLRDFEESFAGALGWGEDGVVRTRREFAGMRG